MTGGRAARRAARLLAVLAVAAVSLAGCAPRPPGQTGQAGGQGLAPQQVLRFNLGGEPPTLDPALAEDNVAGTVIYQMFEGLVQRSPEGPMPGIAESWDVSPDGLTYTFHLRQARWSNGDPVTAGDFEYAWKRVLDPATGAPYAYILYLLKGAEAYNQADPAKLGPQAMRRLRDAVGVKAADDRTLVVTLERPAPFFLELTAFFTYLPVDRKVVEANPRWAVDPATIVVNGPFRITAWHHRSDLTLVKNERYWDAGAVRLQRIEMVMVGDPATSLTMYENGEIDMAMSGLVPLPDTPRLLASGDARRARFLATYYYAFNTARKPFDDPRVRRAFALAIDRKALVENVLRGGQQPALAMVPGGIRDPATGSDFRQEGGDYLRDADVREARRLLAEAGYPDGRGFPRVTLLYNQEGTHGPVAEAIQQMWRRNLGVEVNLARQEGKVFLQTLKAGDFDIAREGWVADYADPLTFLDLFTTGNPQNDPRFSDARYDDLIARARATVDQGERMRILHEAERLLMEEMPVMPIYFYVQVWQQRDYVLGVRIDAQENISFKSAYIAAH